MIALLLAVALAADPAEPAASDDTDRVPAAPERPADQDGDCRAKRGAPAGSARDCAAVSVPPSYLAHLESTRVYSERLRLHLVGAAAVCAAGARSAADSIAWRDAEIARLQVPTPFLQRSGTHVGLGVLGGAALTVAAGWALGQAAQ